MDGGTVQDIVGSLPLAIILVAGVCAPLAGWLAMQRSRNPALWFVFGALTGPVALLLLLAAPVGRCPRCETRAAGWAGVCTACGTRLGGIFDDDEAGRPSQRPVAPAPLSPFEPGPGRPDTFAAPETGTSAWPPLAPPVAAAASSQAVAGTASSQASSPPSGFGPATTLRARAPSTMPLSDPTGGVAAVDAAGGEVLATAIYLSGNAGLEIGACYA